MLPASRTSGGEQIALDSGALLTVRADGTFDYDPNGAFDTTPVPGSGAANMPASDVFSYTLAGGGTATVTITINGLDSNDILIGAAGPDTLTGGIGDDVYILDNAGDAAVEAPGEGSDGVYVTVNYTLASGTDVETLSTLDWNGTAALDLAGNGIANWLIGNAGANQLRSGGGNDIIEGKGGDDLLDGGAGADHLAGGLGNDVYILDNAGDGTDAIYATASYALNTGAEVESLSTLDWGSTAALNLTGNEFGNYMIGNAGANVLDGKGGNDALVGREGADIFAFTSALGGGGVDHIADMVSGTDRIALDDAVFSGLGLGALNANAFRIGASAQDADDRIVYNGATGELFFDADGNGAGAAVLFAIVDGAPALAVSDFTVI